MATQPLYDERELLHRLTAGDEQVFSQIFVAYYPAMCQFADQFVNQTAEAEDIVEDVFLKLLEGRNEFNDLSHLKAYLYRSIRHSCLDLIKTSKRSFERNTFFTTEHNEQEDTYLSRITRAEVVLELQQAIAKLPLQAGRVITLTYIEGKSNQEAADEMGLSINTIKAQKQRGLGLLRQIMPKDRLAMLLLLLHHL